MLTDKKNPDCTEAVSVRLPLGGLKFFYRTYAERNKKRWEISAFCDVRSCRKRQICVGLIGGLVEPGQN